MSKTYWLIRGYDSSTMIYERKIDSGQMTVCQVKDLLKALAAKTGLGLDEIVGAYAKRRTKITNDLLLVQKEGPYPTFHCGSNPLFIAAIAKIEGERLVIFRKPNPA
jgi:hypothetical protein